MTIQHSILAQLTSLEARFDGPIPRDLLPQAKSAPARAARQRLTLRIAERRRALSQQEAAADPVLARLTRNLCNYVLQVRRNTSSATSSR
jgi:hypothetical protein